MRAPGYLPPVSRKSVRVNAQPTVYASPNKTEFLSYPTYHPDPIGAVPPGDAFPRPLLCSLYTLRVLPVNVSQPPPPHPTVLHHRPYRTSRSSFFQLPFALFRTTAPPGRCFPMRSHACILTVGHDPVAFGMESRATLISGPHALPPSRPPGMDIDTPCR